MRRTPLLAATLLVLSACATAPGALSLSSEPLEFYNPGCDGYRFESRVNGNNAVLKRTQADGTDAGALVFRGETDAWQYVQDASHDLIIDGGEPAFAERERGRVCFRFNDGDTTDDACFASLIKTGAICTKTVQIDP